MGTKGLLAEEQELGTEGAARSSGGQDPHSTFISLLLPSLAKGQVKKTRRFFQRGTDA